MSGPKLTPWFPPHIKPVRVGWYIATVNKDNTISRWWDGSNWNYGATTDTAHCIMQERNWRGLAERPKARRR